jgi:carboxymethylenebutenolidase
MQDARPLYNVWTGAGNGGYLATPHSGSAPGVVVLHEWWGLNGQIIGTCNRFAREGFVALAPDLFGGHATDRSDEGADLSRGLDSALGTERAISAVDYLLNEGVVAGRSLGVVGYCMGGAYAYRLAAVAGDRIKAAAPFYGLPGAELDVHRIKAAILGHYGEADGYTSPAKANELAAHIRETAGSEVRILSYPGCGHAFCNEENPTGTYSPEDCERAWAATVQFFREQLD